LGRQTHIVDVMRTFQCMVRTPDPSCCTHYHHLGSVVGTTLSRRIWYYIGFKTPDTNWTCHYNLKFWSSVMTL